MQKEWLGKLFVLEQQQIVNFTAPNVWNNKVLANKNSFPEEIGVDMGITTINLYTPELFGKVSPLNENTSSTIVFKLDTCFVEEGQMINKIHVIPKKDDNRFAGRNLFIGERFIGVYRYLMSNVALPGLKAKSLRSTTFN